MVTALRSQFGETRLALSMVIFYDSYLFKPIGVIGALVVSFGVATWLRRHGEDSSSNADGDSGAHITFQQFIDAWPNLPVERADDPPMPVPSLMARFDWRVYREETRQGACCFPSDPRTVIISPKKAQWLLSAAKRDFDASRSDRLVVFHSPHQEVALTEAFGDGNLSKVNAVVSKLSRYFSRVLFYVKDADVDGVVTMPIPLSQDRFWGRVWPVAAKAIVTASLDQAHKHRSILAAWGKCHPEIERADKVYTHPRGQWAQRERHRARAWSALPQAVSAGVELRSIGLRDWWAELATYRFLLSPPGTGIQRTSLIEALLVLTVPITLRGEFPVHDDLVSYGFPIVVLSAWEDITAERVPTWWSSLAPRLEGFRSRCLTTDAYWLFFTGRRSICSGTEE